VTAAFVVVVTGAAVVVVADGSVSVPNRMGATPLSLAWSPYVSVQ
jgi:hypothetical protein